MDDTRPEVAALMRQGYRRMTAAQKLARVFQLTDATRQLARTRLREEHPAAPEREIELRLAALRFDRATMIRVFGWDPSEHGA